VAERANAMLTLVQMSDFAKRLPGQLSGGQQQRVALARALAIEPKILLLDEPFSALDKNLRLDMQIEIKGLLKTYGLTSIIVTHDQEEALSMADRIVVLNRGRIEQVDAPDRLYDRPANLFVNRFVGHANVINGVVSATNAATATIDMGGGARVVVANSNNLAVGRAVILSIRPENLAIVQGDQVGAIPATVHLTLPLGPTEIIEARIGSGKAIKLTRPHTPSTKPLQPGAVIHLAICDLEGISVFALEAPPASARELQVST
jgi:putative spermidine/putrescine transport system ATP-binding protein